MKHQTFTHHDILSVEQFSRSDLSVIMERTDDMKRLVETKGGNDSLKGKIMTALFYEPSSRTFGSFIASMQRLGGGIIPIQGVSYSSVSKGESLPDTVRTFENYSDVIVLRHPEVGSAKIAAEFAQKPVINAGDGIGEHPTQALLDFYTITQHFPRISGLTITMVGDMYNGRTIHSLAKLLSLFEGVALNFISPDLLRVSPSLLTLLKERKTPVAEYENIEGTLGETDVLYVTRVQKERFSDLAMYEKLKHRYIVTPKMLFKMKKKSIIMHPFPRVGEITMDVDLDPRAVYISEQMRNGLYVRMALLSLILRKEQ
ncbi:aspartate carbamoyltransferase [Candidatus Gottesmanbacteria bacterium]|nr:aspartate carbamoyltransferase [Candidatus Gottesmanbacteria bacterium]